MLPNIANFADVDYRELPRAMQRLMARGPTSEAATLPRRSFLKMAGAGGFALGAFPHLAMAQADGAAQASGALKPTQQPSAFVQIAPNGEVTVTINRLEFGQGVQTGLPMILAEELDADWALVRSRNGSSDAAYVDPLFGSLGLTFLFIILQGVWLVRRGALNEAAPADDAGATGAADAARGQRDNDH